MEIGHVYVCLKLMLVQPPDLQVIPAMHFPNLETEDISYLNRIGLNN